MCVSISERERERVCVGVCESVCVGIYMCLCATECVYESTRQNVFECV